jgi:hypothetical protein
MPPARIDLAKLRDMIEIQALQQWKAAEMLGVSTSCVERTCKRLGLKTARTGPRAGPGHPNWNGGRILRKGYWLIWTPDGYVSEHRLVMEQKIGRKLTTREVVHHIDGDPQNNDPANLMTFQTNAEHLRHELIGRVPNWSPEGKERVREANRQRHSRNRSKRGG